MTIFNPQGADAVEPQLRNGSELNLRLPLVTVIVTNYNYGAYVRYAIESVAKQTYPRLQCVVVDDCSSDGSPAIIEAALASLNRSDFSTVFLDENLGQLGAMAAGLQSATGVFVNFLDADDVLMPGFVAAHVSAHLNSLCSCSVTASDTIQIDHTGQMLEGTYHSHWKPRATRLTGDVTEVSRLEAATRVIPAGALLSIGLSTTSTGKVNSEAHYYIEREHQGWPVVASSSFVFRRNVAALSIPRQTRAGRICADYYLYKIAHAVGGTICIPAAHSFYRIHTKNAFAINPVVGGPYQLGAFRASTVKLLDGLIATHFLDDIETWSALIGPSQLASFVQNGIFRDEVSQV